MAAAYWAGVQRLLRLCDGNGGIAIAESNSAEAILEATAPWVAFFHFTVRPIVPTDRSPAIFDKALAWRDSIR